MPRAAAGTVWRWSKFERLSLRRADLMPAMGRKRGSSRQGNPDAVPNATLRNDLIGVLAVPLQIRAFVAVLTGLTIANRLARGRDRLRCINGAR